MSPAPWEIEAGHGRDRLRLDPSAGRVTEESPGQVQAMADGAKIASKRLRLN
jgi:hypothetical protein